MKILSVPEQHQLKIAKATLRMSDIGAKIMGGMTKDEARLVIQRLTGNVGEIVKGVNLDEKPKSL